MASLDVERLKVIKFCPLVNSINQLSSTMNNSVSLTQACIMAVNTIKASHIHVMQACVAAPNPKIFKKGDTETEVGSEVKNIGTISRIYMLKACIKHNVIIKQIYGLYNCFSLFSLLLFLPCFCKIF